MTDTTFPFETVGAGSAEAEPERDSRRLLAVLGGGLAAVALVGAAMFTLGGGDDPALDEAATSSVVRAPRAEAAPVALETQTLPVANTEAFARNPFSPRYVAPPVVAAAPAGVPQAPGLQPLPLPLDLGSVGSGSGPVVSPVPTTQAPPPAAEYPLTLVSVSDPQPEVRLVTWSVDGSDVQVIPGQRFGRYGELVVLAYSLQGPEGSADGVVLQVGDGSPVVVTVGETISVL